MTGWHDKFSVEPFNVLKCEKPKKFGPLARIWIGGVGFFPLRSICARLKLILPPFQGITDWKTGNSGDVLKVQKTSTLQK